MRKKILIAGLVVVITIFLVSIARPETDYQIGDLMVTFPQGPWQIIKADKDELILKIMTFEPVVRRYEFITHELISVRCCESTEVISDNKRSQYLSDEKAQLINVLGLLMQKFLLEGFEIKESSFIEVAGAEAYRFELIREKIPLAQWLKGDFIRYASHIVVCRKDWYLITYCNFDNPFAGPHFADFAILLDSLKFIN